MSWASFPGGSVPTWPGLHLLRALALSSPSSKVQAPSCLSLSLGCAFQVLQGPPRPSPLPGPAHCKPHFEGPWPATSVDRPRPLKRACLSPPIPSRPRPVPFQLCPISFLSPPTKVTPIRPRLLCPPRPSPLLAVPSLSSPGTWPCALQASSPCTGPLLTRLVIVVDSDQGGLQELRLQHPVNPKAQHCVFLMGELERTESCLRRPGPLTVGH